MTMGCDHDSHTEKVLADQCRLMTAILGKDWEMKMKRSQGNDEVKEKINRETTSSVSIQIKDSRAGSIMTVAIPRPAPAPCSGCGTVGRLRCGVCHAWYCTAFCQASDWPRHRGNCVHPPALLWPDGVLYDGEEVLVSGEEEEQDQDTMITFNQLVSDVQDHGERNSSDTMDELNVSVLVSEIRETPDEGVKVSKPKLDESKSEIKSSQTYGEEVSSSSTIAKCLSIPQLQSSGGLVSLPSSSSRASRAPMSVADDSDRRKCKDVEVPAQVDTQRPLPPGTIAGLEIPPPPPAISHPNLNTTVGASLIELKNFDEFNDSSSDELITVSDFKMMTMKDIASGDKDVKIKETAIEDKDARARVYLRNMNKDITAENQDLKIEANAIEVNDVASVQQFVGETVCELKMETVAAPYVATNKDGETDYMVRVGQVLHDNDPEVDKNRDDVIDHDKIMPLTIVEMVDNTSPLLNDKIKDDEVKCRSGEEVTEVPEASEVEEQVKVLRGSLALGSKLMAVVCHLDTPLVFYICPTTSVEDFTNIFTISQDCPLGKVRLVVGNCCLVQDTDDECWYRGEIVEIADEVGVTMFLLDSGKVINSSVDKLKPLPKELKVVKGLVSKVNLKGVKSVGEEWSRTDIDKAMHILDVGNDVTTFKVKVVKIDSKGEIFVVMKNMEGKDVASVMIDAGIVSTEKNQREEEELDKAPIKFKLGTISHGLQTVVLLKLVSPMEVYFCSVENFVQIDKCMTIWKEAADKADDITNVVIGDPVLACDDGIWFRAMVTRILLDNRVEVELVDVASCSILHLSQLKKPSADVMKGEVMAVSCCLESWVKDDRVKVKEKWESRVSSLVKYYVYEEMQVTVVGKVQGQLIVSMPELEEMLKKFPEKYLD